jgi:exopolysaccharide production protein ExoQ
VTTTTARVTALPVAPRQDVLPVAPPAALPGWAARNWFAICALALMMASDYKLRVRSATDTLAGGIDVYVLLEIAVYGLVALYLLLTQPELPRLRGRIAAPLFLASVYVGLLVVAVGYSPFKPLASVRAVEMLVLLALTARACRTATSADLHRFAHGFLALVASSVVCGIVWPQPPVFLNQAGRFTWLRVHPIPAGVYCGLATLVALGYLLTRFHQRTGPVWPAWVYAGTGALVGWGLIATETRNAVLGTVVGALVLVWGVYRGRRLITISLGLVVALAALVLVALPTITAYFARGESAAKLATLNSRTSLWSLAFDAVRHQPVFGYGQGASRGIFLDATGLGGGHNALINVAVDLGGVGLLVWLALLAVLVRGLFALPTRRAGDPVVDRALALAALSFLLVDGMFFEGLGAASNVAGDWLFVLVAWVVVLHRRSPAPARPVVSVLPLAGER